MMVTLALAGFGAAFVPFVRTLWPFIALQGLMGFFVAGLEVGYGTWIVELWPDSNAHIQGLHASLAFGQAISPIVTLPFISNANLSGYLGADLTNESQIDVPYTICAGFLMTGALVKAILHLIEPYEPPQRTLLKEVIENESEPIVDREKSKTKIYVLIFLVCLMVSFEHAAEEMHFEFLPTFVVNKNISNLKSQLMALAFSSSYTISTIASIWLANKFSAQLMLTFDLIAMSIGSFIMFLSAYYGFEMGLWVSSVVLGLAFASFFPSAWSFLEERVNITNFISGLICVSSSIGSIFTPLLIGAFVEEAPLIFVYVNLACCLTCVVIFLVICVVNASKE